MDALITNVINNIFHMVWLNVILLEPKYSRKKSVLFTVMATGVFQAVAVILIGGGAMGRLTYLAGYLSAVLVFGGTFVFGLSAAHPAKSLFLVSSYFCLWTFIYGFISVTTETYAGAGNTDVWLMRIGLNLFFLLWFLGYFRKRFWRVYRNMGNGSGTAAMISFLAFFMLSILLIYNESRKKHDLAQVFIMVSAYVFLLAVYAVLFRFMVQAEQEQQLKELQFREKLLLAQLESYGQMEWDAKQTRHDIRHHNMVVMELARKQDCKGILTYLAEYEEREVEKTGRRFCGNYAVDSVLSAYLKKAEAAGISTETQIQAWETSRISDYDLVSILANVLENAVHGCLWAEGERRMKVCIWQKKSKLVIICSNSCGRDILFKDGIPKARGRDGIGVQSILRAAGKYEGNVDFSAEGGVFTCRVILSG